MQAAQINIKAAYCCILTCFEHLPHLVVSVGKDSAEDTELFITVATLWPMLVQ
jgi:hypothetical protein